MNEFARDDVRLALLARPVLCAAVRRIERWRGSARALSSLEALAARGPARAILVIDRAGRPVWVSSVAEPLLRPQSSGGALPAALVVAARRLAETIDRWPDLDVLGALTGRTVTLDGAPTRVELSVMRSADGEPMIVAELPQGHGPSAALLVRRFGLTRAEAAVVELLADGLSNAAIAGRLFISVDTVKTHLLHSYAKLGVHTRLEALLRVRGFSLPDAG